MFKKLSLFKMCSLLLVALCCLPGVVKSQTIYLNQNTSQTIDQNNGTSCGYGPPDYLTSANSYFRAFKISDYAACNSFTVDSVKFGIAFANSVNGSQLIGVNLYSLNSGTVPTTTNMTLISSNTYSINDGFGQLDGQFLTVATPATIPGTGTLVVEIASTDGATPSDEHYFYMGSNGLGQTKPSYWFSVCNTGIIDYSTVPSASPVNLLIGVYGRPYNGTPLTIPGDFINPVDSVCEESTVTYSVPQVAGLTYNWVYTGSGVSLNPSSPVNQNTVILDFPFGATSGNLGVYTSNGSTVSPTRWLAVSVLPAMTSTPWIDLSNGVLTCNGGTFASYAWYRNGVIIPGATASTYTTTQGGDYYVKVSNGVCETFSLPVTLDNPTGVITASSNPVCANTNGVVMSIPDPVGPFYVWTYSGTGVTINNNGSPTVTMDFAANATSGVINVSYGNSAATTKNITVNPLPNPTISRAGNVLTAVGTFTTYQWYRNDLAITGATNATYTMTQAGSYYVKVTNSNGCVGSSTPAQIDDVVGIKDIELASKIKIYPNPAKDIVTIESPVTVNVTLTRIDGRVMSTLNNAKKIDLKSLSAGIYFITLTDKDGGYIKKEKLVKVN